MSYDKNRKIIMMMITAITPASLLPDMALAQSLFGSGNNNYYYGPSALELGFIRTMTMLISIGCGFALGWFMSPQAKELRKLIFGVITVIAIMIAMLSNSPLGWSLTMIVSIIGFFVGLGFWLGQKLRKLAEVPSTFGSSKYADADELDANGLFDEGGIRLGTAFDGEGEREIFYHGERHCLISAPTRSQKGTSQIVPNLLSHEGSVTVIDPKGENALITAIARQDMGQKVMVVDPWQIAIIEGLETARFNPLEWLVKGDPDVSENAMLLADAIIVKTGDKEAFWDQMAVGYLQGAILYVATDEHEAGQRHLPRVRDLMMLDGEDLRALFGRMLESPHHVVASTGARMLQMDEKLLSNVMASVQSHTQFLDSPRLRENLSTSDFRFEDLKTEKISVYLVIPADRLQAFSPWLRLLVQQAITVNARNIEQKPEQPILFILDEMAALGRLTMVEQAYGLMAGFGMQLYGVVQDLGQLKRVYGDGYETFIGNSGVIQYFGSRDRMSAEYFSALCGETTVWNFSTALSRTFGSSSGKDGGSSSSGISETDTTAASQRKLAYPDELMRLPDDKQLVFIENMNPIIATKVPWYEDNALKSKGVNLHKG